MAILLCSVDSGGAECATTEEWAIPGDMIHGSGNEVTCRFKLYKYLRTTVNKFIHTCIIQKGLE